MELGAGASHAPDAVSLHCVPPQSCCHLPSVRPSQVMSHKVLRFLYLCRVYLPQSTVNYCFTILTSSLCLRTAKLKLRRSPGQPDGRPFVAWHTYTTNSPRSRVEHDDDDDMIHLLLCLPGRRCIMCGPVQICRWTGHNNKSTVCALSIDQYTYHLHGIGN